MRLFSIFRNKKASVVNENLQTIYFKNFQLFKVVGKDESNWYDADVLVLDGKSYDLNSIDSINSIPIITSDFIDTTGEFGTTGMLDYVLRMKAGHCYTRKEKKLCSALLWKSTELMQHNKSCLWQSKDYQRLIYWHCDLGMLDEANEAERYLKEKDLLDNNVFDSCASRIGASVLQNCKEYDIDFVVFHNHWECCGECAAMNGRVYSISGKDKVFPKLPEYAKRNGNFHPGCRCTMSPYFGGDIFYRGDRVDAIKASLRPFVDDRTPEQKQEYEDFVNRVAAEQEYEKQKLADKKEYSFLLKKFPDETPKSFGSYRRMKNGNTSGFKKLQEKAHREGIEI